MNFKDLLPFLSPAGAVASGNGGLLKALGIGSKGGGGPAPAAAVPAPAPAAEPPPVADSMAGIAKTGADLNGAIAANDEAAKHRGPLADIGDFIKSPEGKATLLRAGAEMLRSGSVGGGIMAGADYADHQKADRAKERESALDRAIRQQQVDQTGQYQDDSIGLQREELGEKRYQYDNPSGSDVLHERGATDRTVIGERGANYRSGMSNDTARRGQTLDYSLGNRRIGLDRYVHDTPSADNVMDNGTTRYTHDNPSGDARLQALGIGSKSGGTRKTEYTIPGETSGGFLGMGGTTAPDKKVTDEVPIPPEIRFDASGLAYIKGPDGTGLRAPEYDRK